MNNNIHYVDLWTKQSELFWRTIYSVPFIGVAIFAGWFGLESRNQIILSQFLLLAGIFIMFIQMAIVYRMAQYLNAFRAAAGDLIPIVPAAFFGLSGYKIGIAIPGVIILLFSAMLFVGIADETALAPSCQNVVEEDEASK